MKYESKDKMINPSHYRKGSIETIDYIQQATKDMVGIEAVCTANIIKYASRWDVKGGLQDIEKVLWYATFLRDYMKENEKDERLLKQTANTTDPIKWPVIFEDEADCENFYDMVAEHMTDWSTTYSEELVEVWLDFLPANESYILPNDKFFDFLSYKLGTGRGLTFDEELWYTDYSNDHINFDYDDPDDPCNDGCGKFADEVSYEKCLQKAAEKVDSGVSFKYEIADGSQLLDIARHFVACRKLSNIYLVAVDFDEEKFFVVTQEGYELIKAYLGVPKDEELYS